VKEEPEDRDQCHSYSQIVGAEKEKGIARVSQGEEEDDEKEIFELFIPRSPMKLERGASRSLSSWDIRDTPEKDPETKASGDERENENRPEVLCQCRHQEGRNEWPGHSSRVVHGPLESESLSSSIFITRLGKEGISRRASHSFPDPIEEPEKENMES